ncbi:hypothetical protein GE061_003034 [Apolygus lucorum]|uniref:Chitin-binding type-2 domain-containing protein n=1 Tax=Apolygus lucorum TaxID=248454 RepID=A0A8S9X4X0_APOLU|nr:hypothetical protein GE061_003034 [Apolygus lucorum]
MFTSTSKLLLVLGLAAVLVEGSVPDCTRRGEYKLPDTDSCKHFYECKDGVATRSSCSWFTLFDNVVMDCQPMWATDCNAIPPEYPPKAWRGS